MGKEVNLLVDCSYIKDNCWGIAIYAINLLKGLARYPQIHITVLFFEDGLYKEFEQLVGYKLDIVLIKHTKDMSPVFISHKLDRLRRRIPFEKELEKRRIDRVFTPFLSQYSFIYPLKYGQIATVHDLQNLKLARQKGAWSYIKEVFSFKSHLNRIHNLVTISKTIQQELLSYVNKKSTLIYNSIPFDLEITQIQPSDFIKERYILDINRFYRYKNAELLIRAFALIKDKIPHKLYLKGSETPIEDFYYLKEIVHSLGLESRVILDVTEYSREELAYIISHADLFVSPSKWEGFGYTPIEAAVFKVPVIVSNINTLTEVTRGKVPSFDPESPEELGNLILSILSSPPSENKLSSLSSYYLQEYSIERQTSEFVNLLLNT